MRKWTDRAVYTLHNKRAQILLPAVLLAPIFVLVIYLLFEMSKVSMTKVRQQFALDNSAYSQMSSASTYLNAVAMVNGPLPYRVMKTMNGVLKPASGGPAKTVFDIFYEAGAFPAIGDPKGGTSEIGNADPKADSTDWKLHYYGKKRQNWLKEDPGEGTSEDYDEKHKNHYVLTSKDVASHYFFPAVEVALPVMKDYITTFIRTGAIYDSQTYVYKEVSKNAIMFREAYYLNTNDCKKSDCGRESASTIQRYLSEIQTKPYKIDKVVFYVSETSGSAISGSYPVPLSMQETIKDNLFQYAYLTSGARSRLRTLDRGVLLKQKFQLPKNHFNINLTDKYKPYVRTTVGLQCPRSGNNCVWPNPLPKYNVRITP